VDPSNFDAETEFGLVDGKGFKVICFTASYAGWLPSPKINDVLILRSIKVSIVSTLLPLVCSISLSSPVLASPFVTDQLYIETIDL
jgi:hypothetical protein